jgi:hypothetical protein
LPRRRRPASAIAVAFGKPERRAAHKFGITIDAGWKPCGESRVLQDVGRKAYDGNGLELGRKSVRFKIDGRYGVGLPCRGLHVRNAKTGGSHGRLR